MPRKAKHKQLPRRKEKKRQEHPSVVSQRQQLPEAPASSKEETRPGTAKPKVRIPVQSIAATGISRYPYMTSEIKWIGILAGIMVAILIILAFILSRFIS